MNAKELDEGRLPIWRRVCYGFTDAGGNFTFSMISSYLTVFYTDVVGLSALAISMIMLIARIWDAVNDPMMGMIAEKTNSRWGRYRPYLLFAAPILAVFTIAAFYNPGLFGIRQVLYSGITYILSGMAYTAVGVASQALANVLTRNNQERMTLISYRGFISGIATLIVSATTMPIILYFSGNGKTANGKGYLVAAVLFSILGTVCYWIAFAGTKEVIKPAQGEKIDLKASLKSAFQDVDIRKLLIGYLLYMCGVFGRVGIMVYMFMYVCENPNWMAVASVVMTFSMMAPNLVVPFLTKRFNKKSIMLASLFLGFLGGVIMFFGGQIVNLPIICVGTAMFHGFGGAVGTTAFGLIAEIIDDMEVRTGSRADAIVLSITSFSVKLGNALAGSLGIVALSAVGYIANAKQSPATKIAMNGVINIAPGVLFLLAMIPFAMIRMTNEKAKENTRILIERHRVKETE